MSGQTGPEDARRATATVVLVGTLDTKRDEFAWLGARLTEAGCATVLLDVGTYSDGGGIADITAEEVATAGGADLADLRATGDRGAAMGAMARGAAVLVRRLHQAGRLDGLLAVGGSSGSAVAAGALQALPVGVPKLLVSTMASGDVSPYVGASDVTLMYSVVDVAGINSVSRLVLGNAVAAIAGMALARAGAPAGTADGDRPGVGAPMFGVSTHAVDEARARRDELGDEVLVFHATGAGGRAMEALVDAGLVAGVLDLTTTELADELLGGVLSAGPHRLEAAARTGTPTLVSVGALDMVNFGPRDSVPERYADRDLLVHNPTVTVMRTTGQEMAALGTLLAGKLATAAGPTEVWLPLGGVSAVDVPGGPFEDRAADEALFAAVHRGLAGTTVPVRTSPLAINDPGFGAAAAQALHELITRPATTRETS